jgi:hypothetical protein
VIYFKIGFFHGDNSTVIMNQQITNQLNISNFRSFPLMLRLSASGNIVIEENYRVWKVIGTRCGTTKISTKQFTQPITMEKCNINKNFG